MSVKIKMLRKRKELTPIGMFEGLRCKPEEFFAKTGHRYAVLAYPNGDCATIDFVDMPGVLLSNDDMVYTGQTSGTELSNSSSEVHKDVYRKVILYGYCVNLSDYPVAVFRFENDVNEVYVLFVPCYWE